jgi:hypothetical protein
MTEDKNRQREFKLGLGLMIGFLAVLVLIFLPFFNGKNGMEYMDDLYNSISKGSAYYVPAMLEVAEGLQGERIDYTLEFKSSLQAERVAVLFADNGAKASVQGKEVQVKGDLGQLMQGAVSDADAMYNNNNAAVEDRYGFPGQAAIYNWWSATQALDKVLNREERFAVAIEIGRIKSRALEVAYNYVGVEPENILDKIGIVLGSLVFYVIYTLWYGFAILFMFEGAGFRLEH